MSFMKTVWFVMALAMAVPAWANLGTSSGAGIPDPSSAACMKAGGIFSTFEEGHCGGAQDSLCRIKDNALIATSTLYIGRSTQAAQAFLAGQWHRESGAIETWANQNCEKLGGRVIVGVESLRPDAKVTMCEFGDRSRVESWTLYEGPGYYPTLAAFLKQ